MRLVTYDGVSAGVENLRLKSGGNVGVNGITDPLAPLHVKDKVDNSDTSGIIIERSANTQRGYISMRGGAFSFNTDSGLPIKFKDNGGTNMTIFMFPEPQLHWLDLMEAAQITGFLLRLQILTVRESCMKTLAQVNGM